MFHIYEGLSESESKGPASPGYQCFKVKAEIHQFFGDLHISPFLLSFWVLFLKFSIQILKGRVCFLFLTKLSIIPHFIVFSSICSWKLLTSGKETSISLFLLEELCILISILIFILSPHPYPHSHPWFLILDSSSSIPHPHPYLQFLIVPQVLWMHCVQLVIVHPAQPFWIRPPTYYKSEYIIHKI